VDGRPGDEDPGPVTQHRERAERQLAPLVVPRVTELGQVGLRDENVERAGLSHQLERAGVDELSLIDCPRVERVSGCEVVRKFGLEAGGELRRKRRERDSRGLGLVRKQGTLATGLGDRADSGSARLTAASEELECLDELVEVLDLDCAIAPEHCREGARRADQGAGVGEGGSSGRLGAPDLEADDGLARESTPFERGGKSAWPAHGLEEEADHLRLLVFREEGEVVRRVRDGFGTRRHDAAESDSPAERQEGVCERTGLAENGDAARGRRVRRATDPGHRAARNDHAHAVRPHHRRAQLTCTSRKPFDGRCGAHSRLRSDTGHDEGSHTRGRSVLERLLDALVVHE
jgi:hypothetical protein